MARMIDLIRDGNAPASILRQAAKGALSVPVNEAIEILVSLSIHRELGVEAEQTLGRWDEHSLILVASDPTTPTYVLKYLLQQQAHRAALLTALCDNPSLPIAELESCVGGASAESLRAMVHSARVRGSSALLDLIAAEPAAESVRKELEELSTRAEGQEAEAVATDYIARHSEEISREDEQGFELVAGPEGEDDPLGRLMTDLKAGKESALPEEAVQLSLLQRLGRMRVGERIKLAMRGNREERMILIRDRSKLVSLAVLESPKVNDSEMESFAGMKNIQEAVLRVIATKRSYMKNYNVLRTLVNNPKAPIDVALPLLQHLMVKDQRALSVNKNVNETVRKMALRMWRIRTEKKKED
jgi:hypothetical protein